LFKTISYLRRWRFSGRLRPPRPLPPIYATTVQRIQGWVLVSARWPRITVGPYRGPDYRFYYISLVGHTASGLHVVPLYGFRTFTGFGISRDRLGTKIRPRLSLRRSTVPGRRLVIAIVLTGRRDGPTDSEPPGL